MIYENYFLHNNEPEDDNVLVPVPLNKNIEPNIEVDTDDMIHTDTLFNSSEEDDINKDKINEDDDYDDDYDDDSYDEEDDECNDEGCKTELNEDGNLYVYIPNESNYIEEGTNIDSLEIWFKSDEKKKAIRTLKKANGYYKKKKYDEAKALYKQAESELKVVRNMVKKLDSSVVSSVLSWAAMSTYFASILNLVLGVQLLIDEKDWWKPTTFITDLITSIKTIFETKDLNSIRNTILSAITFLIDYSHRRQNDCDKKKNKQEIKNINK